MISPSPGTARFAIRASLLVLLVLAAYFPVLSGGFIWDDDSYVTENNTLRTAEGLRYIWAKPGATTQYYPVVHTTFWVEYHLWGLNPAGYHIVNVLLHAIGSILAWRVLAALGVPGAWLAAAIFALHPVHVESAGWITERKNVLSGVFYLSSFLIYLKHRKGGGMALYGVALLCFLLALGAKSVTASLPAAILVGLWWKNGRLAARDVVRLIPFFLCGIAAGLFTAWIERNYLGATGSEWDSTLVERTLIAGRALWFYASKIVWPAELIFFYPRWEIDSNRIDQFIYPAAALLLLVILVITRKRTGRGPLAAVLFFGGSLAPALGYINVYPFRFSFVADHFQYLASIGLIALAAGLLTTAFRRIALPGGAGRIAVGGLLLIFATLTWNRSTVFRDIEVLWRDTIKKNEGAWMAYNNLGSSLIERGEHQEAIALLQKALALKPEYARAHNNLGIALDVTGRKAEAIRHYAKVIEDDPDNVFVRNNLGVALVSLGRIDEGIRQYRSALAIRPHAPQLYTNLGLALQAQGRFEPAVSALEQAVRIVPEDAEAHFRLGLALEGTRNHPAADKQYEETLRLNPGHGGALDGRARISAESLPR